MNQHISKVLIVTAGVLLVVGLLFYFPQNKIGWFGKLPGDFSYRKGNFSFYAPFTTMLIISIVVTVILRLIRKFF